MKRCRNCPRALGYVGKQAALQLFEEHEQGQDVSVSAASRGSTGLPRGKAGRRLVGYSIGKGLKYAAVSSFPLNLYEDRKQLRRGDAARRGILRKKFASKLSGSLRGYAAAADKLIVGSWIKEIEKGKA